ncbi:hypothetical protein DYB37_006512 [Aphanomyces astaci]|uniref:Uncharacterized protein n=1 Tax=Aphanomyces astaci TaxID=112090 RepID=A0A418FBR8_APHAT|nr:hypothetical protein DYB37_006512 [Aphanomyces astaci]
MPLNKRTTHWMSRGGCGSEGATPTPKLGTNRPAGVLDGGFSMTTTEDDVTRGRISSGAFKLDRTLENESDIADTFRCWATSTNPDLESGRKWNLQKARVSTADTYKDSHYPKMQAQSRGRNVGNVKVYPLATSMIVAKKLTRNSAWQPATSHTYTHVDVESPNISRTPISKTPRVAVRVMASCSSVTNYAAGNFYYIYLIMGTHPTRLVAVRSPCAKCQQPQTAKDNASNGIHGSTVEMFEVVNG